jgi:hypothetical protein
MTVTELLSIGLRINISIFIVFLVIFIISTWKDLIYYLKYGGNFYEDVIDETFTSYLSFAVLFIYGLIAFIYGVYLLLGLF